MYYFATQSLNQPVSTNYNQKWKYSNRNNLFIYAITRKKNQIKADMKGNDFQLIYYEISG